MKLAQPFDKKSRGEEWFQYYEEFPYFSHEKIRAGCHPWKFIQQGSKNAIVLVHGLTDSPHFVMDLGRFFYESLGYSVFIPLLQCHALKDPKKMQGVQLEEWRKNVAFAVDEAQQHGQNISIGGFSAGGTLSLDAILRISDINGGLYLFSAALELAGGAIGRAKEMLLRSCFVGIIRRYMDRKPLIGTNPYRYATMNIGAAKELVKLIDQTQILLDSQSVNGIFDRWVFAAHSESDNVAGIAAIEKFSRRSVAEKFTFWRIAKLEDVTHSGMVLEQDIFSEGEDRKRLLEKKSPLFQDLLEKIRLADMRMKVAS